jgi:hypothetical protein
MIWTKESNLRAYFYSAVWIRTYNVHGLFIAKVLIFSKICLLEEGRQRCTAAVTWFHLSESSMATTPPGSRQLKLYRRKAEKKIDKAWIPCIPAITLIDPQIQPINLKYKNKIPDVLHVHPQSSPFAGGGEQVYAERPQKCVKRWMN